MINKLQIETFWMINQAFVSKKHDKQQKLRFVIID